MKDEWGDRRRKPAISSATGPSSLVPEPPQAGRSSANRCANEEDVNVEVVLVVRHRGRIAKSMSSSRRRLAASSPPSSNAAISRPTPRIGWYPRPLVVSSFRQTLFDTAQERLAGAVQRLKYGVGLSWLLSAISRPESRLA